MNKTIAAPYDSAEYLDSPEAIAAYLRDAMASGSQSEVRDALVVVERAKARLAAKTGQK